MSLSFVTEVERDHRRPAVRCQVAGRLVCRRGAEPSRRTAAVDGLSPEVGGPLRSDGVEHDVPAVQRPHRPEVLAAVIGHRGHDLPFGLRHPQGLCPCMAAQQDPPSIRRDPRRQIPVDRHRQRPFRPVERDPGRKLPGDLESAGQEHERAVVRDGVLGDSPGRGLGQHALGDRSCVAGEAAGGEVERRRQQVTVVRPHQMARRQVATVRPLVDDLRDVPGVERHDVDAGPPATRHQHRVTARQEIRVLPPHVAPGPFGDGAHLAMTWVDPPQRAVTGAAEHDRIVSPRHAVHVRDLRDRLRMPSVQGDLPHPTRRPEADPLTVG